MKKSQKEIFLNRINFIRFVALLSFLILVGSSLFGQTAHKSLRFGDNAYEKGDFSEAEINYRRALEKENAAQSKYNLGNAIYKQNRKRKMRNLRSEI